ncbi:hypothetical protein [Mobiluncus mulieris]|nr:hypothetical protein [Mobiluncus mulieris]
MSETRINALVNEANQVAAAGDAAKDWQQLAPDSSTLPWRCETGNTA